MKTKIILTDCICILLMLNFFYEGIYKIAYLHNYNFYVTNAPLLKVIGKTLTYVVPIYEIVLSILLLVPSKRKLAIYSIMTIQIVFIFWVMSVYLFTDYLFWPYHAFWTKPTWMEKMSFALLITWLAFMVVILSDNKILIKNNIINQLSTDDRNEHIRKHIV